MKWMIRVSIRKRTYQAIYRLLNRVSPLDSDCGELCGAACCTKEKTGEEMGIYLLPGEDKVHNRKDAWLSWSSAKVGAKLASTCSGSLLGCS